MNLKINDKEYLLQWGMGCIEMYCDSLDCEIDGLEKVIIPGKEQIKALTTLILCAIKCGAGVESYYDDFEVSYRELQTTMDTWEETFYKAVVDDFKASRYFGKTMAEHLFLEVQNIPAQENPGKAKKSRSAKL